MPRSGARRRQREYHSQPNQYFEEVPEASPAVHSRVVRLPQQQQFRTPTSQHPSKSNTQSATVNFHSSPVLSPTHPEFDARDVQHSEFERLLEQQRRRSQQQQQQQQTGPRVPPNSASAAPPATRENHNNKSNRRRQQQQHPNSNYNNHFLDHDIDEEGDDDLGNFKLDGGSNGQNGGKKNRQRNGSTSTANANATPNPSSSVPVLPTPAASATTTVTNNSTSTSSSCCLEELVLQLTPTPAECAKRYSAFCDVRDLLRNKVGLHCYVFGSQRTGIALPSSDVDVVARTRQLPESVTRAGGGALFNIRAALEAERDELSRSGPHSMPGVRGAGAAAFRGGGRGGRGGGGGVRESRAPEELFRALNAIRREKNLFYDVQPIIHARVPIIKLKHRRTGCDLDICFQDDGLVSSDFLSRSFDEWSLQRGMPARALTVLLKAFVAGLGVNDPAQRGVGSFVCSLLVMWFLSERKRRLGIRQLKNNKDSNKKSKSKNKTSSEQKNQKQKSRGHNNHGRSAFDDDDDDDEEEDEAFSYFYDNQTVGTSDDEDEDEDEENENSNSSAAGTGAIATTAVSLSDLWTEMLHFYVHDFDCHHLGVDCERMVAFQKPYSSDLVLMNPLDKTRNAASAAGHFIPIVVPAMDRMLRILNGEQGVLAQFNSNNSQPHQLHHSNSYNNNNNRRMQQQQQRIPSLSEMIVNPRQFLVHSREENSELHRYLSAAAGGQRWTDPQSLRQQVSNVPALDAEGWFCARTI